MTKKTYFGYAYEKLSLCIDCLVTSSEPIQNKIDNIYQSHLLTLENELEMKDDLQDFRNKMNEKLREYNNYTFEEIMELISKNNRGISLTNEQAEGVAKTILSMFNDVIRARFDN